MKTAIFRNPEQLDITEVVQIFEDNLKEVKSFKENEIEQLAEIYSKNPVDKFIIYENLDVEAAQGDILIWASDTSMYKKIRPAVSDIRETDRFVLQEGDSLTGDHRLILLKDSKYKLEKGVFPLDFLSKRSFAPSLNHQCTLLKTNKPFLIVHREHGNIALPSGEYLFCSQLDSSTLTRMLD